MSRAAEDAIFTILKQLTGSDKVGEYPGWRVDDPRIGSLTVTDMARRLNVREMETARAILAIEEAAKARNEALMARLAAIEARLPKAPAS